jgi:hypothetical protein
MKEHLINLLFEQFKFNCFIHQFDLLGIKFPKFEVNNNQIVLDIIGFPPNGIIESHKGPDYDTFHREGLDSYLGIIIRQMIENKEVELTNNGLHISENYESFVKGELAKYIEMLLKELADPNQYEQASRSDLDQNNLPLNLKCPRMTTVLHVLFEKGFESKCKHEFKIHNPVVLPAEGEIVDFEWRNFLDNEDFIKELEYFDENDLWFCNIHSKKYYKNHIETTILLTDEKTYKEYYKDRWK